MAICICFFDVYHRIFPYKMNYKLQRFLLERSTRGSGIQRTRFASGKLTALKHAYLRIQNVTVIRRKRVERVEAHGVQAEFGPQPRFV